MYVWQHGRAAFTWQGLGSCFPWTPFHQKEFHGYIICSAWVWTLVSCEACVSTGILPSGSMLTGLVCAWGLACPGIQSWLASRSRQVGCLCASNSAFIQVGFWRSTFRWAIQTSVFFSPCHIWIQVFFLFFFFSSSFIVVSLCTYRSPLCLQCR
jgi:hypothetical protein